MMRSCFFGANSALNRPTAVLAGPETFSKECSLTVRWSRENTWKTGRSWILTIPTLATTKVGSLVHTDWTFYNVAHYRTRGICMRSASNTTIRQKEKKRPPACSTRTTRHPM